MMENQQENGNSQNKNSHVARKIFLTIIIAVALVFFIRAITNTSGLKTVSSGVPEKNFTDPNKVTKEEKEQGFTTERIYKHFQDFIELYFPDDKDAFEGWTVQYKKNEEWNNVSWTSSDGGTTSGHYEGMCDYGAKIIYLNDDYFPRYDSHDDVLIHEMIHVVHPAAGHQGEFMDECTRIGKISPFTRARIYGYSGWGSVE